MEVTASKAYVQAEEGQIRFWVYGAHTQLLMAESRWKELGEPRSIPITLHLVTVNDQFDSWSWATCWICGHKSNHWGEDHGSATGDGLTRYDIVARMNAGGHLWRS
jgi:hypothetical protein